jgi:hypothetical protein
VKGGTGSYVTAPPSFEVMSRKQRLRCRNYRYRLHPTVRHTQALNRQLIRQCEIYNAVLEERKWAWELRKHSVTYFDQCKTLAGLDEVRPEALAMGSPCVEARCSALTWPSRASTVE